MWEPGHSTAELEEAENEKPQRGNGDTGVPTQHTHTTFVSIHGVSIIIINNYRGLVCGDRCAVTGVALRVAPGKDSVPMSRSESASPSVHRSVQVCKSDTGTAALCDCVAQALKLLTS